MKSAGEIPAGRISFLMSNRGEGFYPELLPLPLVILTYFKNDSILFLEHSLVLDEIMHVLPFPQKIEAMPHLGKNVNINDANRYKAM